MKTTKKVTKKVTKAEEPKFILNYTNCETPNDLRYELIIAKIRGEQLITEDDLHFVERLAADAAFAVAGSTCVVNVYGSENEVKPKKPWYKRFWNWLIRK